MAVYNKCEEIVKYVRDGNGPVLVEAISYRWLGHSTSDPGKYRTKEEVDEWKQKDPITRFRNHLIENKIASEKELDELYDASLAAVEESVKFALSSPEPTLESAFEDIYAD